MYFDSRALTADRLSKTFIYPKTSPMHLDYASQNGPVPYIGWSHKTTDGPFWSESLGSGSGSGSGCLPNFWDYAGLLTANSSVNCYSVAGITDVAERESNPSLQPSTALLPSPNLASSLSLLPVQAESDSPSCEFSNESRSYSVPTEPPVVNGKVQGIEESVVGLDYTPPAYRLEPTRALFNPHTGLIDRMVPDPKQSAALMAYLNVDKALSSRGHRRHGNRESELCA